MLDRIIGQEKAKAALELDLKSGNIAHAYLLAGPIGVGKMTAALEMAKSLQTREMSEQEAAKTCDLIDKNSHLDTRVARIESGENWKIEQIKKYLDNLNMTGNSNYRILIVENIDQMKNEAANAMLKMLEEPPGRAVYIFTTSRPDSILATIMSRVRRVDFTLINQNTLVSIMKNKYRAIDQSSLERIAFLAQGRLSLAFKLVEQPSLLESYQKMYDDVESFLTKKKTLNEAFLLISQIHTDSMLVEIMIDIICVVLREKLKSNISESEIMKTLAQLDRAMELKLISQSNANSRLMLEHFMISI